MYDLGYERAVDWAHDLRAAARHARIRAKYAVAEQPGGWQAYAVRVKWRGLLHTEADCERELAHLLSPDQRSGFRF